MLLVLEAIGLLLEPEELLEAVLVALGRLDAGRRFGSDSGLDGSGEGQDLTSSPL